MLALGVSCVLVVAGAGAAGACSPSGGPGEGHGWAGHGGSTHGGQDHEGWNSHDAPGAAPCSVVASTVVRGTATFTVGPQGCTGEVGPISFSTYSLPGGHVLPYADQVLFAHAAGNGASYGAGTYTLTAALPECSWQADLYWGVDQGYAPHKHPLAGFNVGWDFAEGGGCAMPQAPTGRPSPAAVPPVPASPSPSPSASPTPAASPTPTTAPTPEAAPTSTPAPASSSAGEVPASDVADVAVPVVHRSGTLSEALVAPTGTPSGAQSAARGASLASTGFQAGPLLAGGLLLVVAGAALVVVRRRRVHQRV